MVFTIFVKIYFKILKPYAIFISIGIIVIEKNRADCFAFLVNTKKALSYCLCSFECGSIMNNIV